jgi:hypothetical protein
LEKKQFAMPFPLKTKLYLVPTLCLVLFSACEIKQKDYKPGSDFIKIYNDSDVSKKYFPAGIAETPDHGFLVLSGLKDDSSEVEFPGVSIFKTNDIGEVEWVTQSSLIAPASGVLHTPQISGYIAMDGSNEGFLVSINLADGSETDRKALGLTMPLAFYHSHEQLVVLGYDYIQRASVLNVYSLPGLRLQQSTLLNVNEDVRLPIQRHMNKTGKELPFFVGQWDHGNASGFFANCYDNYSIRIVFFDVDGKRSGGNIYSFQDEAAISSLLHKDNDLFSLTRYYKGENYIIPEVRVDIRQSQNFNYVTGFPLPELVNDAKVFSNRLINGKDTSLLFCSYTHTNTLKIFQYAMHADELINEHETVFGEKVEMCGAIITEDNGMALLARIYVLGKHPRPLIVRMPASQFRNGV